MLFIDVLAINNNEVLSLVGAGGKTSLLLEIGEELREKRKILVTTTTKIYKPERHHYDGIFVGNTALIPEKNGVYVYGSSLNEDSKILPLSKEERKLIISSFDTSLIEADGAKRKLLKGWREDEPIIDENTTLTLGVFNIEALGMKVKEENIHRVKEYISLTGATLGDTVKEEAIVKLILHEKGMFKGARGKRVLFINGIENHEAKEKAERLASLLQGENKEFFHEIIGGSLRLKTFERLSK